MQEPLNITFIVSSNAEYGTYYRFHNLARNIAGKGHTITVVANTPNPKSKPRKETVDGVCYQLTPSHRGQSVFTFDNHPLNFITRSCSPIPASDVCHLFQPFLSSSGQWLIQGKRRAKACVYDWDDLWGDGGLLSGKKPSFQKKWFCFWTTILERRLPRYADSVTACSSFLIEKARSRGAKTTYLLYNGFTSAEQRFDKREARKHLNLREDAIYAGFMGKTLTGLNWCYRSLDIAATEFPSLRLAICGPPESALSQIPVQIRSKIDYLGILSQTELRQFSTAVDFGLLPLPDDVFNRSRFPIKFFDYLSSGLPVLCSEVGEISRLAKNIPSAIPAGISEESWHSSFIETTRRASGGSLPNPKREEIAAFTWNSITERLIEHYRHIIETKSNFQS